MFYGIFFLGVIVGMAIGILISHFGSRSDWGGLY